MVNHTLGIAIANPLDFNLLFERFLSVRRASLPDIGIDFDFDIDIDVESARRLEVYDRIIERFGTERVAVTACRRSTVPATPSGSLQVLRVEPLSSGRNWPAGNPLEIAYGEEGAVG